MADSLLSVSRIISHDAHYNHILQMRKVRLRKLRQSFQGHTADTEQGFKA